MWPLEYQMVYKIYLKPTYLFLIFWIIKNYHDYLFINPFCGNKNCDKKLGKTNVDDFCNFMLKTKTYEKKLKLKNLWLLQFCYEKTQDSNCDKTQKLKFAHKYKTQIVTKLLNSNNKIFKKLLKVNCHKTKKNEIMTKVKTKNVTKLICWQISKTPFETKLKISSSNKNKINSNCEKTQIVTYTQNIENSNNKKN